MHSVNPYKVSTTHRTVTVELSESVLGVAGRWNSDMQWSLKIYD